MADVQIKADVSEADLAVLRELAARRGVTANTVLQQAISTEKLLADAVDANDKVLIEKSDGSVYRVLFDKTG
jgi:hypothetical protein